MEKIKAEIREMKRDRDEKEKTRENLRKANMEDLSKRDRQEVRRTMIDLLEARWGIPASYILS